MSCARGCCQTQREHYKSLRFGADRNKTMSNGYTLAFEQQEAKDMDAYRRLRKDGLQPPDWTGCAALEQRAASKTEIELGAALPKPVREALTFEDA